MAENAAASLELAPVPVGPLIHSFRVEGLFGRYTYQVRVPEGRKGDSRLVLLYGDNGSGKTTLLRLVWHLLSPAGNRHHRSALGETPFQSLHVKLMDGTEIEVKKDEGVLIGSFDIGVSTPTGQRIESHWDADSEGIVRGGAIRFDTNWNYEDLSEPGRIFYPSHIVPSDDGQDAYLGFLGSAAINPLLLADDRSLYSDDPELERLRGVAANAARRLAGDDERKGVSRDLVARELAVTIRRVNDWLRQLALGAQNVGSAGANSIYHDVLQQLASPSYGPPIAEDSEPSSDLTARAQQVLKDLAIKSPRFEEFDLVPHFPAEEFLSLLDAIQPESQGLAEGILTPYLESLQARYAALEVAEDILRSLLPVINDFLVDKQVVFSPRNGLRIVTDDGAALEPNSLSSGERQLTMLLCTTLLAGRDSRLFIIDEPELSLGINWQRRILDVLLELTRRSSLQFLVATHSVEILTGQPEALVSLERQ